jgi:hypothetical protein
MEGALSRGVSASEFDVGSWAPRCRYCCKNARVEDRYRNGANESASWPQTTIYPSIWTAHSGAVTRARRHALGLSPAKRRKSLVKCA